MIVMELRYQRFLEILKCALKGEQASGLDGLTTQQWQELTALATAHKVLPLCYQAVHHLPGAQEALAPHQGAVRRQVMLQTQKTYAFLELNRALRSRGITALVVKGIVCRELYPTADLRQSADEDVLVPQEQYDDACHLLEEQGMTVSGSTAPEAYETPYRKKGSPLYIELHRSLFPPEEEAYGAWNAFFADAFSRAQTVEIHGEPVLTMAPTDHLLYLILHAFKHFIHSGVGIRQVCDIIMYANAQGKDVDWDRLWTVCDQVRCARFAGAVLQIGRDHLTFDPAAACCPEWWLDGETDVMPLLEDILAGGVYGGASLSRQHSSNMTLNAVAAENRGEKHGTGFLRTVFPAAKNLQNRYPYLKKHPYLVPVAWAERLLKYRRELSQKPDSGAAEALSIGSRRLELLRQYGII